MRKMIIVLGSALTILLTACSVSSPILPAATGATTGSSSTAGSGTTNPSTGPAGDGKVSGRFTETGSMVTPRAGHTATLLPDGNILVAGGGQLDIDDLLVSSPTTETFDPSLGRFLSSTSLLVPREFHTATLLRSGKILFTGGNEFYGYPTWLLASATAELYDPSAGVSVQAGSMSIARTGHTASVLPDGRVLVMGGTTAGIPSAEIFDATTGSFSQAPTPQFSRSGHTATVLLSGKVLFAGGRDKSGALATAEIFDPASNAFTAVDSMAEARTGHTATLLPNGKVLVAGGGNAAPSWGADLSIEPQVIPIPPLQTAELFDPQTESFLPTARMTMGRAGHSATLLPDGSVLLSGGAKTDGTGTIGYQSYDTAEIYDPVTDAFKEAGTMNTGRFEHTATILPNGTVVFIGGISHDLPLNSAETFK